MNLKSDVAIERDVEFMRQAIRLVRTAGEQGDKPVGSVVVCDERTVGEGIEAVRSKKDLTAHAELRAVWEGLLRFGLTPARWLHPIYDR